MYSMDLKGLEIQYFRIQIYHNNDFNVDMAHLLFLDQIGKRLKNLQTPTYVIFTLKRAALYPFVFQI